MLLLIAARSQGANEKRRPEGRRFIETSFERYACSSLGLAVTYSPTS